LKALMQDWPLTVDKILDHAKNWHGDSEVVSRSIEGPLVRSTYARVHARAKRLSSVLVGLAVAPGDRVATLAWNNTRHLELWYGIMGMGAICHTLNPRLFADQLVYIINEARNRLLFVDRDLLPIVTAILGRVPTLEHIIVLTDGDHMPAAQMNLLCYERLLEAGSADFNWGGFEENTAAGLCFTSGTLGNPKGVLYSHRSSFLHCLMILTPDAFGLSALDTVLPIVPMFHANAWGLAFAAPAVGAKVVFPGNKLDGAAVHELLETEAVTFSAAVPTVWQALLQHLRSTGGKISTLKRVAIGGSAVPEFVIRAFRDDYGVDVLHAWGMTEMSPVGTIGGDSQATMRLGADHQLRCKVKQGRPPLGVEMKLTDDENAPSPHDGATFGRLKVRGFAVAKAYLNSGAESILDDEGFFDTGDVATIDEFGLMQIVDRTKDVIKSGGEWISSIEVENIAIGHPKIALAAAIGMTHPKWGERPRLYVKLRPGESVTGDEVLQFLSGKIAKWWIPDEVVFVDDIPLGPTGKIDKKALRRRFSSDT
jgi:fatty-acyl-CoA synthase